MLNFESFDRATQPAQRKMQRLTDNIDSQLDAAQQRHQERLALLNEQYEAEQPLIEDGLGSINAIARARVEAKINAAPNGIHPTALKQQRDKQTMKKTKPNHVLTIAMFCLFMALLLMNAEHGPDTFLGIPSEPQSTPQTFE